MSKFLEGTGIMYRLQREAGLERIYDLLCTLGVRPDHTYFFYTSYALYLSVENPDRLHLVSKWLYPDVAAHYGTDWRVVERNIRITIQYVWKAGVLQTMCPLERRPTPAKFLRLMTELLTSATAA